jgi:hypothetical protein
MRKLAGMTAFVLAFGVGAAVAGTHNDDDNDYEGRAAGQNTYFGFDLSPSGKRVSGITAYLHYDCEGKEGNVLLETKGELKVKDGEFSGKTTGESKVSATYKTEGKLGQNGRAKGTLKVTGTLGADTKCKAGTSTS